MKNNKKRGFSLAELLIALLVISIVLSAAIPTITKRNARREQIWQWAGSNNAYFGAGSGQSALLGITNMPRIGGNGENGINEGSVVNLFESATDESGVGLGDGNARISNHGDKLVILKQSLQDNVNTNLMNSHISFYNLQNGGMENEISYAGRIALDTHNIAFGIGTLLSSGDISDSFKGYNTAIGHYTLTSTVNGQYNTAVGERALNHVKSNSNTGIGFEAGFLAGQTDGSEDSLDNTAVGARALRRTGYSNSNTAVGAYAMANVLNATHSVAIGAHALESSGGDASDDITQDVNTAVGTNSLMNSKGSGNTALGANACSQMTSGSNNICIGYNSGRQFDGDWAQEYSTEMSHGLFIGSYEETDDNKYVNTPLIYGKTQRDESVGRKEIGFSADRLRIGNFDGYIPDMAEINIDDNNIANYKMYVARTKVTNSGSIVSDEGTSLEIKNQEGYVTPSNQVEILAKGQDDKSPMTVKLVAGKDYLDFKERYKSNTTIPDKTFESDRAMEISTAPTSALKLTGGAEAILSVRDTNTNGIDLGSGYIRFKSNKDNNALTDCEIYVDGNFELNSRNLKITSNDDGEGAMYISAWEDSDYSKITFQWPKPQNLLDRLFHPSYDPDTDAIVIRQKDIKFPGFDTGVLFKDTQQLMDMLHRLDDEKYEAFFKDPEGWWSGLYESHSGASSDIRLKNIISDAKEGLNEILALQVKKYTFKDDKDKVEHIGVIAQDLQEIFPNSVFEGNDGYLRIKTDEILFSMVNAVKELYASIQDLIVKVADHDKRIEELEKQNKILIKQNKELEKRLERLEKKSKN